MNDEFTADEITAIHKAKKILEKAKLCVEDEEQSPDGAIRWCITNERMW